MFMDGMQLEGSAAPKTLLRVTHVCGACLLGSGALALARVGQLAGEGGVGGAEECHGGRQE